MSFLKGKKILISGILNKFSLSWGIALAMYKQGAEIAFTCQNEKIKKKIKNLAKIVNCSIIIVCDVLSDKDIFFLFKKLKKKWSKFDGIVHSIAYAPPKQLQTNYLSQINRKDFMITHEISSYSFTAFIKSSKDILNRNSSLLTITYLGSHQYVPNYNILGLAKSSLESSVKYLAYSLGKMKIRVNSISSGPIKTTSSYKINNFSNYLSICKSFSPMQKNVSIEEIGNVAAFLCSDLSSGITGQNIFVDAGLNISHIL